jgi:hypothetical protein
MVKQQEKEGANRMDQQRQQQQQIKVELKEPEAEGIYSNWVMITYSPSEFVIDYGRILPGLPKTRVYSRIVMTPQHVKRHLELLEKNVKSYEEKFGEIKMIHGDQGGAKGIGF